MAAQARTDAQSGLGHVLRRGFGAVLKTLVKTVVLLAILVGPVLALSQFPRPRPILPARQGPSLSDVKAWGYQLQRVNPASLPPSLDLMVVDYSRNGAEGRAWTAAEVETIRRRPDGTARIVLAYMSVGEAENYRFYWWSHWATTPPKWLGPENPNWPGNFPVRFWHQNWSRNIIDPEPSTLERLIETRLTWRKPYIDRIIEAGFDGVYLDRVDIYEMWLKDRPSAQADMATFVTKISAYAKSRRPGFLVVPQNGEELLKLKRYRDAIDGAAKEDLFFGVGGNGVKNPEPDVAASRTLLDRLRQDKRPVFVVEYLDEPLARSETQRRAADFGYALNFTKRGLNASPEPLPPLLAPQGAPDRAIPPPIQSRP
jgi:cysteinyl-tRNA synthetase, unknown class